MLSYDSGCDFVSFVVLLAMYMCYMVFFTISFTRAMLFVVVDCFVTSSCSEHCVCIHVFELGVYVVLR